MEGRPQVLNYPEYHVSKRLLKDIVFEELKDHPLQKTHKKDKRQKKKNSKEEIILLLTFIFSLIFT